MVAGRNGVPQSTQSQKTNGNAATQTERSDCGRLFAFDLGAGLGIIYFGDSMT
jgi:hypothetical protein